MKTILAVLAALILSVNVFAVSVTTFAGSTGSPGSVEGVTGTTCQFNHPRGVFADVVNVASGALVVVADTGNCTIRGVTSNTSTTTIAGVAGAVGFVDGAASTARFNMPMGVTGCTNTVFYYYVADTGNNAIRAVTAAGATTTLAGAATPGAVNATGTAARFNQPTGICTDGTYLYVCDTGNHLIRKVTVGGVVTILAGSGAPGYVNGTGVTSQFYSPTGICTDGTNVYVADSFNNCVRQIVIGTGVTTTLIGSNGDGTSTGTISYTYKQPFAVAWDYSTKVYVADTWNSDVKTCVQSTKVGANFAGTDTVNGFANGTTGATNTSSFFYPRGIYYDSTNAVLYIADTENNAIRKAN